MRESWPVVGEGDRISAMPKEAFTAIEIEKVRLEPGRIVNVSLKMPLPGGASKTAVRTFDFSGEAPAVRLVANPLLD